MLVKMTHPKHGVTHAYGAEIEWNKKHGWVVEEKKEAPVVVIPEKRKPGRPPKK